MNLIKAIKLKQPASAYTAEPNTIKRLHENGYITMDKDGLITLTDFGMEIAVRIYKRHKLLSEYFIPYAWMKRPTERMHVKWSMTSERKPLMRFADMQPGNEQSKKS